MSTVHTTPVKPKAAVFRLALILPSLVEYRKLLDREMRSLWIGLMTPDEFMDYFMDEVEEEAPDAKFPSLKGKSERDMYVPIVSVEVL